MQQERHLNDVISWVWRAIDKKERYATLFQSILQSLSAIAILQI